MRTIVETTGRGQGWVEENLEGFYLEHSDLSLEEVLQDQETVYQSLQASNRNDRARASASGGSNVNNGQRYGEEQDVEKEGESSHVACVKSQLELDEALAINLQEVENQLLVSSLSESTETEAVNREADSPNTSAQVVGQNNIDTDNMTYEELQLLEENIGSESRGLSEEVISYLPTSKYRTGGGFFSKKDKTEECVICKVTYKNRDKLITLPCDHPYHSKCITHWLKLNKACPVCKEEVFGS